VSGLLPFPPTLSRRKKSPRPPPPPPLRHLLLLLLLLHCSAAAGGSEEVHTVEASYLQIYMERCYDLLALQVWGVVVVR
jgi:hypothetical protein